MRIIIDAMGGDNAPMAIVQGAIDAMTVLTDADAFHAKYGDHAPLLFAMGAGMVAISSPDTINKEMSVEAIENMIKEYIV